MKGCQALKVSGKVLSADQGWAPRKAEQTGFLSAAFPLWREARVNVPGNRAQILAMVINVVPDDQPREIFSSMSLFLRSAERGVRRI